MSDIKVGSGLHTFVVGPEQTGERLDKFLSAQPALVDQAISRTRVKALIEDGRAIVRDMAVREAGAKLGSGDIVTLDVPAPADATPQPEDIPLTVVFEDDQLIVIDKPVGLVVHPAAGNETGTLVNALLAHCGASLSGIGGVRRPGIVHRLDKDTSGLMVVAKTDAAHQSLAALFADHGRSMPFVREYRAFAWGVPSRAAGTVEASLDRHATHREKMAVVSGERGRHAVTHWRVAQAFKGENGESVASEIVCRLETGRTHQIRVHLAHIGHSLLGDRTYGSGFQTKASLLGAPAQAALASLGRQALHASKLGFPHPVTGEQLEFDSALPADLQALLQALRDARAA